MVDQVREVGMFKKSLNPRDTTQANEKKQSALKWLLANEKNSWSTKNFATIRRVGSVSTFDSFHDPLHTIASMHNYYAHMYR